MLVLGCTRKKLEPRLDTPLKVNIEFPAGTAVSNYEVLFLDRDGLFYDRVIENDPRKAAVGRADAVLPAGRYGILVMVNRVGQFDLYPVPLIPKGSPRSDMFISPAKERDNSVVGPFLIGYTAECQVHNHQESSFTVVMEELDPGENLNLGEWTVGAGR